MAAGRVRESSFRAFLAAGGAAVVASLDLDILSFEVHHAERDVLNLHRASAYSLYLEWPRACLDRALWNFATVCRALPMAQNCPDVSCPCIDCRCG